MQLCTWNWLEDQDQKIKVIYQEVLHIHLLCHTFGRSNTHHGHRHSRQLCSQLYQCNELWISRQNKTSVQSNHKLTKTNHLATAAIWKSNSAKCSNCLTNTTNKYHKDITGITHASKTFCVNTSLTIWEKINTDIKTKELSPKTMAVPTAQFGF